MFLIALDPEEGEIEFDGNLWPPEPSLEGFREVITQEARYLEMLSLEIGELGEAGFDLSLSGFDEFELGELFAERNGGRRTRQRCRDDGFPGFFLVFTLSKRKGLPHLSGSRPRDSMISREREIKHLGILLQPRNGSIDKFQFIC